MRRPSPLMLTIVLATAILLAACASKPPVTITDQETASIDPVAEINQLESEIANARQNNLDLLSPDTFDQAEKAFEKAKNGTEKDAPITHILENIATTRQHLQAARENAKVARSVLAEVIESRRMARNAGATKLEEDYAEIEERFLDLTRAIEKNNISYAKKNAEEIHAAFRKIELRAIKIEMIGEVRSILKQAKNDDLTEYAPEAFREARKHLEKTDQFITENPYAKQEMYKMAQHDLFMARRAVAIADQVKVIQRMSPQEIAYYIEDTLTEITNQLGAQDMRDQKFYVQVENILGSIESLQNDNQFLAEKLKDLRAKMADLKTADDKRIDELNQQIAFLKGKTKEEQAEKERLLAKQRATEQKLAAERRFNQLFFEVQNYFDEDEAEVYKKGDQLVLRLSGIQFPIGQAVIMPENYQLLSKAQKAIRTFGEPSVIVEGHTDSTGTLEFNKHLSQQRAQSVREYLIANQTLPPDKVIAVGYGPERPLASNETAEGRAINRRIDIIIIPESMPGR